MSTVSAPRRHSFDRGLVDGHRVLVLGSRDDDLQVTVAPRLGMVVRSMRHRGDELLGLRTRFSIMVATA